MPDFLDNPLANERPMVLIVSADGPIRILVARVAARLGLTALIALDGTAAIIAARNHDQSLLCAVLDSHLPTLSAWEVAWALQPLANLPVVVLDQNHCSSHHLSLPHIPTFAANDVAGLSAYLECLAAPLALA